MSALTFGRCDGCGQDDTLALVPVESGAEKRLCESCEVGLFEGVGA